MNKMYRQGDVLFIEVDEIPYRRLNKKDNIVALGEETGHYHEVVGNVETYSDILNGVQWVVANEPVTLEHKKENKFTGDHATLPIPAGKYKVVIQREESPVKPMYRDWD